MNQQEKLKELKWKYFREQKKKELNSLFTDILKFPFQLFLVCVAMATFMVTIVELLPHAIYDLFSITFISYGMFSMLFSLGFMVILGITWWVCDNYQRAEERAKKKLKIK